MNPPYELQLGPRREPTLDELIRWFESNVTDSSQLLPRIAGGDTTGDIYNYLTGQSLGNYLGMLAQGGLGNSMGIKFGDTAVNIDGEGIQDRTATGNLGSYVGSRFNVLDQSDTGIIITVTDKVAGLGAYSGVLSSLGIAQTQQTGAGLGIYIGQQVAGTNQVVQGSSNSLGVYVGQQAGTTNQVVQQTGAGLGSYVGQQLAAQTAHSDSILQGIAGGLAGNIGGVVDTVVGAVEHQVGGVVGSILDAVVGGAGVLGDAFKDALEWLVDGAFDSFESLFGKRINNLHRLMNAEFNSIEEIVSELDYGVRGGSIVSMLESVLGGVFMIPPLIGGIGQAYADPHVQQARMRVASTLLSMTDIRDGYLRGQLDDHWVDDQLARYGFDSGKTQLIKGLFFDPAPPSDLVRFLVREVFDPQQRQALQLDGDYPAAADAEGRKVGLAPETMRNYWAAHWQLPSPGQVFEMLHRGLIDPPTVDAYLKAADFSPAWRGNLANISYNVPGRIDLRRMYAAGVINEARVRKGYQDLGYTAADADALTRFAVTAATPSVTELPRGVVLEAYREGTLDRNSAIAFLATTGFIQPEAVFMLDLEDLKNARELQGLNENAIEADLKAGLYNEGQAMVNLSSIGVPVRRAQILVNLWRSRHAAKTTTLNAAQVQHAVREHLIPPQVGMQRLAAMNYNPADAQILIALATPQAPADTPPTLTLSHLFRGLREGLLTPPQLSERLARRGYSPEDVRILIELATPDQVPAEPAELTKAELIAAAKKKSLPVDAVQRRLAAKGYSAQDVDVLLLNQGFDFTPTGQLLDYPRRDLTVAQLSKSYRTGLIDEKEFRFRLGELAYADADIDLLVELATPEAPIV